MENRVPLKYRISSWTELPGCLSNNSNHLHIHVADFVQEERIRGLRISVEHELFGTLFAHVVGARGSLFSHGIDGTVHDFEITEILAELYKFGYDIEYHPQPQLSDSQIKFLQSLNGLQYDKLRWLNVRKHVSKTDEECKRYIVAFNVNQNPNWLNGDYVATEDEFFASIENGSAFNASALSTTKEHDWSWLGNLVINISDVVSTDSQGGSLC